MLDSALIGKSDTGMRFRRTAGIFVMEVTLHVKNHARVARASGGEKQRFVPGTILVVMRSGS